MHENILPVGYFSNCRQYDDEGRGTNVCVLIAQPQQFFVHRKGHLEKQSRSSDSA